MMVSKVLRYLTCSALAISLLATIACGGTSSPAPSSAPKEQAKVVPTAIPQPAAKAQAAPQEGKTKALAVMHKNNPAPNKTGQRPTTRLCSGQALLCRALRLSVQEWSGKSFNPKRLYIEARATRPPMIATARLGIRRDRDDGRQTRFIHGGLAHAATSDPRTRRAATAGTDFVELPPNTSL